MSLGPQKRERDTSNPGVGTLWVTPPLVTPVVTPVGDSDPPPMGDTLLWV